MANSYTKHNPMKLALCYRGQVRNHDAGAIWKEKLVHSIGNTIPVDVRVFAHTSQTEALLHTLPDPDFTTTNVADTLIIPKDEMYERLHKYSPVTQRLFNHAHIYRQAQSIMDYWSENDEFASFIKRMHPDNKHIITRFLNINYTPELSFIGRNTAAREQYFINQIYIGNFIAQYASAGHSLQMLDAYHEDTGWTPDMVISLRFDTAMEVLNPRALLKEIQTKDHVFGNGLCIRDGHAHGNDLAFVMNYKTATSFLGDIDQRIFKLLTDWTTLTSIYTIDEFQLAHNFWNYLVRHDTRLVESFNFDATVIRAGFEDKHDPTAATFTQVREYFNEWRDNVIAKRVDLIDNQRFGVVTLDGALELLGINKGDVF